MEPVRSRKLKARNLVTGESGKRGKQQKESGVTRQALPSDRIAVSGSLQVWSGLKCPGDVFR